MIPVLLPLSTQAHNLLSHVILFITSTIITTTATTTDTIATTTTPTTSPQAELLGTKFRHAMYPDPASGGGVLRLHATYRHDLKIKASDEGRVMKTAAAFTKGLLELEGNLTPILASLVTVEEKDRIMLDKGGNDEIKQDMDRCKEHMASLLQSDAVMTEELAQKVAPNCPNSLKVNHSLFLL